MSASLRRGLPRESGGQPWPPEGTAVPPTDYVLSALGAAPTPSTPAEPALEQTDTPAPAAPVAAEPAAAAPTSGAMFRRGLPRVEAGEPWPPAESAPAGLSAAVGTPGAAPVAAPTPAEAAPTPAPEVPAPAPAATQAPIAAAEPATTSGEARRGLPREEGGQPWPPEGTVVAGAFAGTPSAPAPVTAPAQADKAAEPAPPAAPVAEPTPQPVRTEAPAPAAPAAPAAATVPAAPRKAPAPAASTPAKKEKPEAKKYGPFTLKQWFGAGAVIALAIVGALTLVVLAARWFVGLEFMQSFIGKYPGEYDLPESAPVGFPGWLGWQHFFNIFLMVLIIRSGILVRRQERPEAFWASKKNPKKISIQLWFHQGLNILWVVNGLIFIILLFATGQWMRVIPTSPEVIPNAVSAGLQYLTLDWPADNGWVNYNSLQQIAYFLTIFVAAPLSAITGYRMSESWPRESKLSDRFPVEWARTLHFPLMIYFVGFIVVHVALVFSTGALRNLNHMFAAQGSTDPSVYAANWTGFWLFVASMVVVAGSWIAARPMVIAPIARIFGNVSAR